MKTMLQNSAVACGLVCALLISAPASADYVAPTIQHEPFGEIKVVVPITSNDPDVWLFRLGNIASGMRATAANGGTMKVKVVVYGRSMLTLKQPDDKVKAAIDAARAAGVQINVCNAALKGMNLDWHTMYGVQEADIVPSGFAEVSYLASHGWVLNAAN